MLGMTTMSAVNNGLLERRGANQIGGEAGADADANIWEDHSDHFCLLLQPVQKWKSYKWTDKKRIAVDANVRCWMRDYDGIARWKLCHELSKAAVDSGSAGSNASSAHVFLQKICFIHCRGTWFCWFTTSVSIPWPLRHFGPVGADICI